MLFVQRDGNAEEDVSVGERASVQFFEKIFMFPLFQVTKSHQKGDEQGSDYLLLQQYYQYDFRH